MQHILGLKMGNNLGKLRVLRNLRNYFIELRGAASNTHPAHQEFLILKKYFKDVKLNNINLDYVFEKNLNDNEFNQRLHGLMEKISNICEGEQCRHLYKLNSEVTGFCNT